MMESNTSELEPSLRNAVQEAEVTKTITPLLKQELKYTILNRRHKTGKGDLVLHEEKPNIKRELTADEKRKKSRRKEQNRRAAQRCREKKKVLADQVLTDYIKEQQARETLAMEIANLKKEKEELQKLLDDHMFNCARAVTPTPVTPNQTPSFEDRTTTFTFPTCPTPSPYGNEPQYGQDMCGQFNDPFETCMYEYANTAPQELQQTSKDAFSCFENCISTINCEELPELDLPDEFSTVFHQQACSPCLQVGGGRQSISEYREDGDCLGYA